MRLVKILGAAIVAVLAFSAMVATGASAHEFEASTTGLLLAKAHSSQLFKFPAGEVVCTTLVGHGKVVELKPKKQVATVSYTNCSTALGTVSEPINAEYEFDAEGSVSILKTVKVIITSAGLKCEVSVLPQSGLTAISYSNTGKEILLSSNVKSIKSNGGGALCNWTNDATGIYTGSALVSLDGGTISWK